jgi:hypothetical protein
VSGRYSCVIFVQRGTRYVNAVHLSRSGRMDERDEDFEQDNDREQDGTRDGTQEDGIHDTTQDQTQEETHGRPGCCAESRWESVRVRHVERLAASGNSLAMLNGLAVNIFDVTCPSAGPRLHFKLVGASNLSFSPDGTRGEMTTSDTRGTVRLHTACNNTSDT